MIVSSLGMCTVPFFFSLEEAGELHIIELRRKRVRAFTNAHHTKGKS
jgi:hypothetical protein